MTGRPGGRGNSRYLLQQLRTDVADKTHVQCVRQSLFRMAVECHAIPESADQLAACSRSRSLCNLTVAAGRLLMAISAAMPSPTMYGTFSVPAGRRFVSCSVDQWFKLMPQRHTYNAPIPFGAYSLWPAIVSRSTPNSRTLTGTFPSDWAQSECRSAPGP